MNKPMGGTRSWAFWCKNIVFPERTVLNSHSIILIRACANIPGMKLKKPSRASSYRYNAAMIHFEAHITSGSLSKTYRIYPAAIRY